jgi:hypothetical protein
LPGDQVDVHLSEGAEVDINLDPVRRVIIIAPAPASIEDVDEEFAPQVSKFIDQYRPALEALARS